MKGFEVVGDGRTVWVNDKNGFCVARFGRYGIDIHTTLDDQVSGLPQCRFCTHGHVTPAQWVTFREKVAFFYDVSVPAELRPSYLEVM